MASARAMPPGTFLRASGPRRLEHEHACLTDARAASRTRHAVPVADRGRRCCGRTVAVMPWSSSWRRLSSFTVTCAQSRVVRRGREPGESPALPGKVVMVQDAPPSAKHAGHHSGGSRVERERAQILDHDHIRAARASATSVARGRFGGVAWPDPAGAWSTGPSPATVKTAQAELPQRPCPLGRFDGDAVGTTETERHHGGHRSRHRGGTLSVERPVPGGRVAAARATVVRWPARSARPAGQTCPRCSYECSDGVARLTINRPERRNAMTWEVMQGLWRAHGGAREDPEVRVVVLTGRRRHRLLRRRRSRHGHGPVVTPASSLATHRAARRGGRALFEQMWGLGKPTVARVQGWAMAGGFGLALACDLVVASERARFGAPE